jgi:diaminopimelate epimerase
MPQLKLTKYHGLGNDFLVLLDVAGTNGELDTSTLARHCCDRRRGVGADGLLVVTAGRDGADVTMELRNADGGLAEMSGNGIRCLAQAVLEGGLVGGDDVKVATDAGVKVVHCVDRPRPGFMRLSVDMGVVELLGQEPRWCVGSVVAAAIVDAGNPHLVLLDSETASTHVAALGPRINGAFAEGINVEWIWPGPGPDELTLKVWERGVGETLACGTGSCAAAAAAQAWGRTGSRAVVHNPGGDLTVELGDTAVLVGPSALIATVEYPWP